MQPHPLDNPAWSALTTTQSRLAIDCGPYKRFPPRISPFCAVPDRDVRIDDPAGLGDGGYFVGEIPAFSGRCEVIPKTAVYQMVFEGELPPQKDRGIELLTEDDGPEMHELVEMVLPGFFRPETWRLGRYIALRQGGRIAAMAGERMALTGYREVSAICTHPDFPGRGYGSRMTALATEFILREGLKPFLHVNVTNKRAQEVYTRLGFEIRTELPVFFAK